MTLIKYGCIFVRAGVIISGGLLWSGKDLVRNQGEHVAEVLAASVEREQVAYLFGDEVPEFGTNVVSARRDFSVLYGAMDAGRDMAVDNSADVYWLDPDVEIESGAVVAGCDARWYVAEETNGSYTCELAVSNASAHVHTTGSRVADEMSLYMPGYEDDYAVMCEEFFPGVGYATNALFGTYNNWWQEIGISSNYYKYGCEHWRGLDGQEVDISLVAGSGFSNAVDTVVVAYPGVDGDVSLISTSTNSSEMRAAVFKLSSDGRDDAWIAVSDGGDAANIVISAKTVTIEEGGSATITIHPGSDIGTVETIKCTYYGEGIYYTSLGWGNPGLIAWGGYNPAWNVPRSITIYTEPDADSVDGAAVMRFERSSQPGVYQWMAIEIVDDEAGTPDIDVADVMQHVSKGGEVSYGFEISPATNYVMVTDKRMRTNNLTEAKAVLERLRRSVVFFDYDDIDFDEVIRQRVSGSTNIFVEGDTSVYGSYDLSDALGLYNALAVQSASVTTNASWGGSFLSVTAALSVDDDSNDDFDYGSSEANASADINSYTVKGCTVDYPSEWAIATGLVARVRVYLCVSTVLANRASRPPYWGVDVVSFSGYSHQPWFYEGFSYGSSVYTDLCSRNDGGSGFPANGLETPAYSFGSGFASYKVVKIADVVDPDEVVEFDIGGGVEDYDFEFSGRSDFESFELVYQEDDDGHILAGVAFYDHGNSWRVERVMVVVDWSWDHLNPDTPFVPTINTPAWVQ